MIEEFVRALNNNTAVRAINMSSESYTSLCDHIRYWYYQSKEKPLSVCRRSTCCLGDKFILVLENEWIVEVHSFEQCTEIIRKINSLKVML